MQNPGASKGRCESGGDCRGEYADQHGPAHQRQITDDRVGVLHERLRGAVASEQHDYDEVHHGGETNGSEGAAGDRQARCTKITRHRNALAKSGHRGEENSEGGPEADAFLGCFGCIGSGNVVGELAEIETADRTEEERQQRDDQESHNEELEPGRKVRSHERDHGDEQYKASGDELYQAKVVSSERGDHRFSKTDRVEGDRYGDCEVEHNSDGTAELDP